MVAWYMVPEIVAKIKPIISRLLCMEYAKKKPSLSLNKTKVYKKYLFLINNLQKMYIGK